MATAILPPGPRGRLLSGSLPAFRRDRLRFFTACARTFGDFVPFRLGPSRYILLNHPDFVEDVLVKRNHTFRKHYLLRMNRLLFGNGLLTSEGEFWLRQRRLAQPAFHRQRIAGYAEAMSSITARTLESWQDGDVRDIHDEMMRLTLEIVAKTLLDADVADDAASVGRALEVVMDGFAARMESLFILPESVPTPVNLRLRRAVKELDRIVYRIIEQRRASGADHGDLLSVLLHARDEDDGTGMTDKQVRDETMTLFLAGHETTAIVLSWAWYLLAQHPAEAERLVEEADSVLGGRPPSAADVPKLKYAEMVVSETMRLFPPVYAFGREPIEDCEIGGYRVAAGTTLFISPWVLHRDPRWFDQPELYRPERWATARDGLPRFAYCPFGGGPRLCIGVPFAMMEAIILLVSMAQRFRLTLAPGQHVEPYPAITMRPRHGLKMILHRR